MARRRGWKRGAWLVRDEESGFIEYGNKVRKDYYGILTKDGDRMHPQDFVRAKADPFTPYPQQPPELTYNTSAYNLGSTIGQTSVSAPRGPGSHLFDPGGVFGPDPGIGTMIIGSTFVVY